MPVDHATFAKHWGPAREAADYNESEAEAEITVDDASPSRFQTIASIWTTASGSNLNAQKQHLNQHRTA